MPSRATERINFGKIKEIIAPPNLIELQTNSYKEFLQADVSQSKRKNLGLQAVFTEVFPIESYDGKCVLDFHSYESASPKWTGSNSCAKASPMARLSTLLSCSKKKRAPKRKRCSWANCPS